MNASQLSASTLSAKQICTGPIPGFSARICHRSSWFSIAPGAYGVSCGFVSFIQSPFASSRHSSQMSPCSGAFSPQSTQALISGLPQSRSISSASCLCVHGRRLTTASSEPPDCVSGVFIRHWPAVSHLSRWASCVSSLSHVSGR